MYHIIYFINLKGHGAADTDPEAEASARLTCHLLLRLFKTTEVPQPSLYSVGMLIHKNKNQDLNI